MNETTIKAPVRPAATRFLWGLLILVLLGAVATWLGIKYLWPDLIPEKPSTSELASYGPVADFELTDQEGNTFSRSELDGRPWIADFVFTRCAGPCPLMTANMARVADSLGVDSPVRFVSFSVDPERDSPEKLKKYAETYGARHSQWRFLTGERRLLSKLALDSFHLGMGDPQPMTQAMLSGDEVDEPPADAEPATSADGEVLYDIPHSLRFALVDAEGQIRAYYDGTDEESLARIYADLEKLTEASP